MSKASNRILIAEDERPLSRALQLKLNSDGFETVIATDGQECLDALKNGDYLVLLLDLMMPVVDGFRVLEGMAKIKNRPEVFVLSNLGQIEDEVRAKSLGANKYFVKSNTPLSVIIDEVKKLKQ